MNPLKVTFLNELIGDGSVALGKGPEKRQDFRRQPPGRISRRRTPLKPTSPQRPSSLFTCSLGSTKRWNRDSRHFSRPARASSPTTSTSKAGKPLRPSCCPDTNENRRV